MVRSSLAPLQSWLRRRRARRRRAEELLADDHCDDAPCVEICPTGALFRREDGIVDFDRERCIGCKACMNGCPYDALYIDPRSDTAAKCNFCAHRVDVGLKPSCEIVCPTESILSGDLDDPGSEVSRIVATRATSVRAPEQGTKPKVHYVGAESASLNPLEVSGGRAYLMTEVVESQREKLAPLADEARAGRNWSHIGASRGIGIGKRPRKRPALAGLW